MEWRRFRISPCDNAKQTKWEWIKKPLFIGLGFFFIGLGAVGVVLPVVPTTPFLLLASLLFSKSSPRLNNRLLKTKILGHYLRHYENGTGVPRSTKIRGIIILWAGLGVSMFIFDLTWVRLMLVFVGIAVSTHIIMIKPKKPKPPNNE